MKIACFYGDNPLASWSLSRGLPAVMRRMGHSVVEIPTIGKNKVTRAEVERINKPITDVDLVLVSGPEYLLSWIKQFYGDVWGKLKCPKVCWYHESETRDDRVADFSKIIPYFDYNFMPNKEDAERYNAIHLQIGVDTEVFHPSECIEVDNCGRNIERTIPCAFIGTMYEKRAEFMQEVNKHLPKGTVRIGNALVQDLDGINLTKSVNLLADEYRRVKILLNLPTLSNVLVSKVLEGAASGCYVLTPSPLHASVGIGYDPSKPEHLASLIMDAIEHDKSLTAKVDCQLVQTNHRLDQRLEDIFSHAGALVAS